MLRAICCMILFIPACAGSSDRSTNGDTTADKSSTWPSSIIGSWKEKDSDPITYFTYSFEDNVAIKEIFFTASYGAEGEVECTVATTISGQAQEIDDESFLVSIEKEEKATLECEDESKMYQEVFDPSTEIDRFKNAFRYRIDGNILYIARPTIDPPSPDEDIFYIAFERMAE